jgi:hypothetical protein
MDALADILRFMGIFETKIGSLHEWMSKYEWRAAMTGTGAKYYL